jgi:hypothetical protein
LDGSKIVFCSSEKTRQLLWIWDGLRSQITAWHVGEGNLFKREMENQESALFVRPSSFEAKVTPDG